MCSQFLAKLIVMYTYSLRFSKEFGLFYLHTVLLFCIVILLVLVEMRMQINLLWIVILEMTFSL